MTSARFYSPRAALRKEAACDLVLSFINTIQLEKDYNPGGVVAEESGKMPATHITLYHDAAHPSVLEIPL